MESRYALGLIVGASAIALVSCTLSDSGSGEGDGEVGTARFSITEVPSDVHCARVVARGSRNVSRAVDLTPGESSVFTMKKLPTGSVEFNANAYAEACSDVDASSEPTWVGEPVSASISGGGTTDVTLKLTRSGSANVSLDFDDDDGAGGGSSGGGSEPNCEAPTSGTPALELVQVAQLSSPVLAVPAPGDDRLYVVEQGGRIMALSSTSTDVFLDISDQISSGGERGLLGLAFHPDYASNGRFFVDYTNVAGDTVVEEYQRSSGDPSVAEPLAVDQILFVQQPYANHNGGMIEFGPDGFLYVALGDGGSGGDPNDNAQNLNSLLGKLLRLDVSSSPYAIPASNPFAQGGGAPELWDYGLRNPWRFSFDACGGDLYIADVGQSAWEEINFEPPGLGGVNYGWDDREGRHCYEPSNGCLSAGRVDPIVEYSHTQGVAVIGGYVYRGDAIPALRGSYLYGDYGSGEIRSFRVEGGAATAQQLLFDTGATITSFGRDASNELYVLTADGAVSRISPQ